MTEPLRKKFWTRPLTDLNASEWEALCDGCGKCCLNKIEDEDSGQVTFTRVACRLLDNESCQCAQYDIRLRFVPDCIVLSRENINDVAYFMPASCAYRLRHEDKPLPDWHPLLAGGPDRMHAEGRSVKGWTVPEFEVDEDDWEDHLIEEPH